MSLPHPVGIWATTARKLDSTEKDSVSARCYSYIVLEDESEMLSCPSGFE